MLFRSAFANAGLPVPHALHSQALIQLHRIIPFYDRTNLDFFKDNVFLNKNDILCKKTSISEIHRNQVLNSYYFGDITIFPNSKVLIYGEENSIGNLNENTINNLVSMCLKNENSLWFKTRNKTICDNCLFVDLCPPISNYELAIGKPNLCNITI